MDKKEPLVNDQENLLDKRHSLSAGSAASAEPEIEAESESEQEDETEADQQAVPGTPGEMIPGFLDIKTSPAQGPRDLPVFGTSRKYVAYTIKLPAEQLAALQSIWLELKRLYGSNSPDKSGMIQLAVQDWLKRWDGPDKPRLLNELLEIRQDTRKRQHKKI